MKSLKSQNYYEILGISRDAAKEDVKNAYEISRQTFQKNSLATYSLFTDEENQEILSHISRAYETLYDQQLRMEYDQILDSMEGGQPDSGEKASAARRKVAKSTNGKNKTRPQDFSQASAQAPAEATIIPEKKSKNAIENFVTGLDQFSGEALKKIRLMKGVSIDQIAEHTKIRKTYLQYLEEEQFDHLPAAVYIKGFVNMIAEYLELPAKNVTEDYMHRYHNRQ